MLTERFERALVYAARLHAKQIRKGSEVPYISHLLAVCALVIEHGGDEDQAIGALLHDAAEDQGGQATLDEIEGMFGPGVAKIVADCTDAWREPKPPWRARKEEYLAALRGKAKSSLLVSLADKVHNARSILIDKRGVGEAIWDRFTGGKEGSLWYYRALAQAFSEAMPGELAAELQRTVDALEP